MYNLRLEYPNKLNALSNARSIIASPFFGSFYFSGRDSVISTNRLVAEFGRGTDPSIPFTLGEVSKSLVSLVETLEKGSQVEIARFKIKLSAADALKSKLGIDQDSIQDSDPEMAFIFGIDPRVNGACDFYAMSNGLNKDFYVSEGIMGKYNSHAKAFKKWERTLDKQIRAVLPKFSLGDSSFSKL